MTAASTLPAPSVADPSCYGCGGTGSMGGYACSCVAVCGDCDEPFAWARDDFRPPARCDACEAAAVKERADATFLSLKAVSGR